MERGDMGLRDDIAEVSEPAGVIRRVLDEALFLMPSASGTAVQLGEEAGYLSCVAAGGQLRDSVGTRVAINGSMTGCCLLEGSLQHCRDAAGDARMDSVACAAFSIASVLCVPLRRRTGAPMGVFVVTSDQPHAFGPADESTLDRLTDFISIVIGASLDLASVTEQLLAPHTVQGEAGALDGAARDEDDRAAAHKRARAFIANVMRPGAAVRAATRERIERVLAGEGLEIVVQPIFALDCGQVSSAEALARFAGPPHQAPDRWFADAVTVGLGEQLELHAIDRALALLPLLPVHIDIAVNAGPETFSSPALFERLEASAPNRITVELTEHVGVDVCSKIRQSRQVLRELGVKVAIDDTGTGFASLSLVLEMAPDVIKLDRELTHGIDCDPVRRALAKSLVGFAAGTGARVVAEGIETEAELGALAGLGVPYAQGYYLARPGSVEELCRLIGRAGEARVTAWCRDLDAARREGTSASSGNDSSLISGGSFAPGGNAVSREEASTMPLSEGASGTR